MLKRKLGFLLIVALLFVAAERPMLSDFVTAENAEYYFYTAYRVAENDSITVVENGSGSIVITDRNNLAQGRRLKEISGHSVSFFGSITDAESLLTMLNAIDVYVEHIADLMCIYAYSPRLGKSIIIDGQKVNLQIAVSGGRVHIGTPILLGSY